MAIVSSCGDAVARMVTNWMMVLGIALVMTASCGKSAGVAIAPGGRINVTNNRGTATVWEVEFEVLETGPGGASFDAVGGHRPVDSTVDETCQLGFGEVVVDLAKLVAGGVTLTIAGKSYGVVVAEDKVRIAADRTVAVNGTPRPPE